MVVILKLSFPSPSNGMGIEMPSWRGRVRSPGGAEISSGHVFVQPCTKWTQIGRGSMQKYGYRAQNERKLGTVAQSSIATGHKL